MAAIQPISAKEKYKMHHQLKRSNRNLSVNNRAAIPFKNQIKQSNGPKLPIRSKQILLLISSNYLGWQKLTVDRKRNFDSSQNLGLQHLLHSPDNSFYEKPTIMRKATLSIIILNNFLTNKGQISVAIHQPNKLFPFFPSTIFDSANKHQLYSKNSQPIIPVLLNLTKSLNFLVNTHKNSQFTNQIEGSDPDVE